jgi:hypothetical protein
MSGLTFIQQRGGLQHVLKEEVAAGARTLCGKLLGGYVRHSRGSKHTWDRCAECWGLSHPEGSA